jgi:hypothetical protein
LAAGLEDKPAHREAMRELNGKWEWRKISISFYRLGFFFGRRSGGVNSSELSPVIKAPFSDFQ